MRLVLHRDRIGPDCALGELLVGTLRLQTIERPWIPTPVSPGGTKGISCVPPGSYKLRTHSTEAHPKTWALVNEDLDVLHWPDPAHPNARTACLIHAANFASELRGCIAPGMYRAQAGQWMVNQSRIAMDKIMSVLPWTDDHTLEISQ